ncbi:MAG: hypothetical protein ACT4OS_09550 [Acidimicrobiales bacterium]
MNGYLPDPNPSESPSPAAGSQSGPRVSRRRLVLGSVGLAAAVIAGGVALTTDGEPPELLLAAGGSRGQAAFADSALSEASGTRMASPGWGGLDFVVKGDLPRLATSGPVWRVSSREMTREDFIRIARALGVDATAQRTGEGWRVGSGGPETPSELNAYPSSEGWWVGYHPAEDSGSRPDQVRSVAPSPVAAERAARKLLTAMGAEPASMAATSEVMERGGIICAEPFTVDPSRPTEPGVDLPAVVAPGPEQVPVVPPEEGGGVAGSNGSAGASVDGPVSSGQTSGQQISDSELARMESAKLSRQQALAGKAESVDGNSTLEPSTPEDANCRPEGPNGQARTVSFFREFEGLRADWPAWAVTVANTDEVVNVGGTWGTRFERLGEYRLQSPADSLDEMRGGGWLPVDLPAVIEPAVGGPVTDGPEPISPAVTEPVERQPVEIQPAEIKPGESEAAPRSQDFVSGDGVVSDQPLVGGGISCEVNPAVLCAAPVPGPERAPVVTITGVKLGLTLLAGGIRDSEDDQPFVAPEEGGTVANVSFLMVPSHVFEGTFEDGSPFTQSHIALHPSVRGPALAGPQPLLADK